jgi:hypothetical protein
MSDTAKAPMIIYDFDPRNLSREMLRAIGLLTAAAAQTENTIQGLIGGLVGVDDITTMALTAQMSALLKEHIARSLVELRAPTLAEVDYFDDLMDRANKAMEKRNTLVHNSLAQHPETGEIFSYREAARGSLQVKFTPITAAEIEKDAIEIYEAGMAVMRFMMSRGLLPPHRTEPLREAINRGKKARAERRKLNG